MSDRFGRRATFAGFIGLAGAFAFLSERGRAPVQDPSAADATGLGAAPGDVLQTIDLGARSRAAERLGDLRDLLEISPTSPVLGNPRGDVTLVEFFDYRCAYCRQFVPIMKELTRTDPGVRIVLKEWPIFGGISVTAARSALALQPRGLYRPMHMALMAERQLTEGRVVAAAERLGVQRRELLSALEHEAAWIDRELAETTWLAGELALRGTPAFVMGGHILPGLVDLPTLRRLIAAWRAETESPTHSL